MFRRGSHVLVLLGLAWGALLLLVAPAVAVMHGKPPAPPPRVRSTTNTQLVLTDTGPGRSVTGFIADPGNTFDPATDPYPSANPPAGFSPRDESFAGVIYAQPPGGGNTERLYCIDIATNTYIGFGYQLGTWNEANVPKVGYVARLLNQYYPTTNEPAALTDLNQKAAAVQAAIWFFNDRYALSTSNPLYETVRGIVEKIQREGPLLAPPAPSLAVTPRYRTGGAGSVLGPFTVTTDAANATVTATGGIMFSDPGGMNQIRNGDTVPSGTKIWLSSTGPSFAVLQATSRATVPTGNVYLYDGNSDASAAQKLILAHTATLSTIVSATAEFLAPGSLKVVKGIAGPAAGSQGPVVIHVACDDHVTRPDFVIPARTGAGTRALTYQGIPAGTTCTVTETANGSVVGIDVTVRGGGQQVTIPEAGSRIVRITDTYHFIGSLLVRKTIAGPGAGQQSPITIHTECNGQPLTPDLVLGAGTPAGDHTKQYDGIAVPATCTVTETADGANSAVSVVVEGSGQAVTVPARGIVEADITDSYGLLPGQLEVTKSIAGPLAGQQGTVVIHTVCDGSALAPDLAVAAGAPAGVYSQIYSNIPTPASCVVTETADGHSTSVPVTVSGGPQTTTIPPGGSGTAQITDTYGSPPGSLLITKTLAGPLAAGQGPVTFHVVCNGSALTPDFVIAAGTPAGAVSHSFDSIPAGSVCTVSETASGATATVTSLGSTADQTVTVPADSVVPVSFVDVYVRAPAFVQDLLQRARASLKVTKTIAGPAARQHGPIAILVACGGPLRAFAFRIPAHTGPGSVSRVFSGFLAGSRCTVSETEDGHTSTVTVAAAAMRKTVTIRAGRMTTVHLTDTFSPTRSVSPSLGLG
jgi:hypothetical protein